MHNVSDDTSQQNINTSVQRLEQASGVTTTQYGARSAEKWDFLRHKDGNVDGKAKVLAAALNRISAKPAIGPIDFLECTTRTQFKQCLSSLVGYTSSKDDCQMNPFLLYAEDSFTAEEMLIKYGTWPIRLRKLFVLAFNIPLPIRLANTPL